MGCVNEGTPIEINATPIKKQEDYNVRFLFEVDGCRVYRFEDARYVYFTNCKGTTQYDYTTSNGKTSTTHQVQSLNDTIKTQ